MPKVRNYVKKINDEDQIKDSILDNIQKLRKEIPLAKLSPLLDMSASTMYERMKDPGKFTLDQLLILSEKAHFSLDKFLGIEGPKMGDLVNAIIEACQKTAEQAREDEYIIR